MSHRWLPGQLNSATVLNRYPLPTIWDFSSGLHDCQFFSKIDLVNGNYQVPMNPNDICRSAIITLFGLYEWLMMPSSVGKITITFQWMMDRLLQGLPFALTMYLSLNRTTLPAVLEHMQPFGLVINLYKSLICHLSVEFLGHHVDSTAISPFEKHILAITNFATPKYEKELQQFWGLIKFYKRFLPKIAGMLKLITDPPCGHHVSTVFQQQSGNDNF